VPTTNFAWTNAAVSVTGALTNNGTFLGRSSKYFPGANSQFAFTATGTDLTFDYAELGIAGGLQFSIDGGAWSTPTLTVGSGSWSTVTVFTGLSDTAHTVVIRTVNGGVCLFDYTNGFALTGSSPAVALTSGYGPITQLSTAVAAGYIKIGSRHASSTSQGHVSYGSSFDTCVSCRFVATTDTIKLFAFQNGTNVRLTIDGVNAATAVTLPNDGKWGWTTVATGLDGAAPHTYQITAGKVSVLLFAMMTVGGTGISTSTLAARPLWAFYGDSITEGTTGTGDATLAYGHLIATAQGVDCRASGRSSSTLRDFGTGASNVTTYSGQRRTADITSVSPAVAVMLYGVNDGAGSGGGSTAAQFGAAAVATLTALAAAIPTIYVLGYLDSSTAAQANRAAFNAELASACAAIGSACIYINTDGWITPATDTADGIHPNAAGHVKIRDAFLASITTSLAVYLMNAGDD
jgi:lysophospholipase L1-like esterase